MALFLKKKKCIINVCSTNDDTSSKDMFENCEIIINLIENGGNVNDFVATDGAFDYHHINFSVLLNQF